MVKVFSFLNPFSYFSKKEKKKEEKTKPLKKLEKSFEKASTTYTIPTADFNQMKPVTVATSMAGVKIKDEKKNASPNADEESEVGNETQKENLFDAGFYNFYETQQYCDLLLKCNGKEKKVHKIIVAYKSKFMQKLINEAKFDETHKMDAVEFEFKDKAGIFDSIIEYMYSGNVVIDYNHIISWKLAANKFDLPLLGEHISSVVKTKVTDENVFSLLDQCFGQVGEDDSVIKAATGHIASNFSKLKSEVIKMIDKKTVPLSFFFTLLSHKEMDQEFDPTGSEEVTSFAKLLKKKRNIGSDVKLNQKLISAQIASKSLTPEIAGEYLAFCEEHNLEEAKGCARLLASVFGNFEHKDIIYKLKTPTLVELLSNDELQVESEDEVLNIAEMYIAQNQNLNEEERKSVMGTVRFSFLSVDRLKKLQVNPPKYVSSDEIIDALWARVGRLEQEDDEETTNKKLKPRHSSIFKHESDFDEKGILYYIGTLQGTEAYQNPMKRNLVQVSATADCENGQFHDIISHKPIQCNLKNKPNTEVTIDLKQFSVRPTHYSIRHTLSRDSEALRNWKLCASTNATSWDTLLVHINDTSLSTKGGTKTWSIPQQSVKGYYQYFKLVQTGVNSSSNHYMSVAGFELYGRLLKKKTKSK